MRQLNNQAINQHILFWLINHIILRIKYNEHMLWYKIQQKQHYYF